MAVQYSHQSCRTSVVSLWFSWQPRPLCSSSSTMAAKGKISHRGCFAGRKTGRGSRGAFKTGPSFVACNYVNSWQTSLYIILMFIVDTLIRCVRVDLLSGRGEMDRFLGGYDGFMRDFYLNMGIQFWCRNRESFVRCTVTIKEIRIWIYRSYRFSIEFFFLFLHSQEKRANYIPRKNDSVSFNISIVILMLYISAKKIVYKSNYSTIHVNEKNRNFFSLTG